MPRKSAAAADPTPDAPPPDAAPDLTIADAEAVLPPPDADAPGQDAPAIAPGLTETRPAPLPPAQAAPPPVQPASDHSRPLRYVGGRYVEVEDADAA
jgi:hypothetical protein